MHRMLRCHSPLGGSPALTSRPKSRCLRTLGSQLTKALPSGSSAGLCLLCSRPQKISRQPTLPPPPSWTNINIVFPRCSCAEHLKGLVYFIAQGEREHRETTKLDQSMGRKKLYWGTSSCHGYLLGPKRIANWLGKTLSVLWGSVSHGNSRELS